MRHLTRIEPALPAALMKTYEIRRPEGSHFRPATCKEVECAAYVKGWVTSVDESTPLGSKQAAYIRGAAGRRFTEYREAGLTHFKFAPEQNCFRGNHKLPVGRPEIYVVRGGDWRGNPRRIPTVTHRSAEDWVDDFANHQDKLATRLAQG